MKAFRVWAYVRGFLTIRVSGVSIEAFLNTSIMQDMMIWNFRPGVDGTFQAFLHRGDYERLERSLHSRGADIEVCDRHGLPYLYSFACRRKFLVLGTLVLMVALYILTSRVWTVEIVGNRYIPREDILEIAGDHGLQPGIPKSRVLEKEIESALKQEFPRISWAGLTIRGTTVIIEVAEKARVIEENGGLDIVAARDGVVEDVILLRGYPRVEEGDTVLRGELLVSGVPSDPKGNEWEPVEPRAVVRARVWYEVSARKRLEDVTFYPTADSVRSWRLHLDGRTFMLRGPSHSPYEYYRLERSRRRPSSGLAILSRLELESVEYTRLERRVRSLGREEALLLAREEATQRLEENMRPGTRVLNKEVETSEDEVEGVNMVEVRIRVEALEDIAVRRDK